MPSNLNSEEAKFTCFLQVINTNPKGFVVAERDAVRHAEVPETFASDFEAYFSTLNSIP
jgi:hypothetical protein